MDRGEGGIFGPEGGAPFITVSRQTGAGGHSLAKELLRAMDGRSDPLFRGWRLYDREICEMVVRTPGIRMPISKMLEKEFHTRAEDVILRLLSASPQEEVLREVFGVVRRVAMGGKAVIVGRGGACLTKGYPGGVHIRLVAPLPARIKWMRELMGLGAVEAEELVREQDKARAALVRKYLDADIEDHLLYDVVWNTGTVKIADVARAALEVVLAKAAASGMMVR